MPQPTFSKYYYSFSLSVFSHNSFRIAIAGHSDDGISPWISTEQDTPIEVSSRKDVLDKIERRLYELDTQQEQLGKQIPPGPQRIRGIAGSGKTVILAQRAAHLHLKHPEWDIAFIFFTRSLYEQIRREVDRWLQRFSNGRVTLDEPNDDKSFF